MWQQQTLLAESPHYIQHKACCCPNVYHSLLYACNTELIGLALAAQSEAVVQADWAAYLHGNYLHSKSGKLASLGLSNNLALSLWAISMVRSRTFSGKAPACARSAQGLAITHLLLLFYYRYRAQT